MKSPLEKSNDNRNDSFGLLINKVHIVKTNVNMNVRTYCGQRGVVTSIVDSRTLNVEFSTTAMVKCVGIEDAAEATCKMCRHGRVPEVEPLDARTEAMITMIYEALRWTSFSVGEGFTPAADVGECIEPDVILLDYWNACGRDHELEELPGLIRDRLRAQLTKVTK